MVISTGNYWSKFANLDHSKIWFWIVLFFHNLEWICSPLTMSAVLSGLLLFMFLYNWNMNLFFLFLYFIKFLTEFVFFSAVHIHRYSTQFTVRDQWSWEKLYKKRIEFHTVRSFFSRHEPIDVCSSWQERHEP